MCSFALGATKYIDSPACECKERGFIDVLELGV